ncbi:MAG: hypothetical protein SGI97_08785 [candidate division Zixibacteria bacterium]|nr:hypothetical protein [candidate division Zixibacteria bacterium]
MRKDSICAILYYPRSLAFVVVCGFFPTNAAAQSLKTTSLYFSAGTAFPLGEFSNRSKIGFEANAAAGIIPLASSAPEMELGVHATAGYYPGSLQTKNNFTFLRIGPELRLRMNTRRESQTYLSMNGGYAYTKQLPKGSDLGFVEHNYFASAAIGIETMPEGQNGYFIEVRLTDVAGSKIRDFLTFGISVGIRI